MQGDSDARRRFHREIEMVSSIDHEHVIELYDAGAEQGQLFFAMEFVDGSDLADVLAAEVLQSERALLIFRQVASALEAMHKQGLVHRDVKPENVLLRAVGSRDEHALLTDFGISRLVDSATVMTLGIGSKHYMAPEVVVMRDPSSKSDQYSLACMLFRMLTGEHVYEGGEYPRAHVDEPIPDLDARAPDLPYAVRAGLRRALSKEPDDRFPSVASFAEAISVEPETAARPRAKLHADLVEILEEAGGWLDLKDLANRVNERRGARHGVTELQVMGRVRTFPHLFQWRGEKVGLLR
jgi:serine/threonine-protein kinase